MCHENRPGFKHTPLAQQKYHYTSTTRHKYIRSSEFAAEMFYYTHSMHTQKKKVALYTDSALLVATGHLLLTRTSVHGVEVPKDGLRLRVTCNNFNDSTISTKGTRRTYPIWVYTCPTSRRMHLVSSKDRLWYLIFA